MTTLFLVRHGLTAQTGHVLYGRTRGIPLDRSRRAPRPTGSSDRFDGVRLTAIYTARWSDACRPSSPSLPRDGCRRSPRRGARSRWTQVHGPAAPPPGAPRSKHGEPSSRRPARSRFPGGGEAFVDAQARAVAGMERIARRHRNGRVVVATHGDIARIVLAHFAATPLDEFQRIVIDTAGVSVLHLGGPRPHVLLVNDTGGLGAFPRGADRALGDARDPQRAEAARIGAMELGIVDRITADAVGEPGMRTFYLQARAGGELVTVIVEKEQVELLARSVLELLADIPDETVVAEPGEDDGGARGPRRPAVARGPAVDRLRPRARIASCSRSTSSRPSSKTGRGRSTLAADRGAGVDLAVGEPRADAGAGPARRRGRRVAAVPRCQFCGNPIDPEGHACPATNGHRKPRT